MKPRKHRTAFTVRKNQKGKDQWTRIGIAFVGENGGETIYLDALPPSEGGKAKIVIWPPKEDQEAGQ